MKKSDKKIDNQLRVALSDVCDSALKDYEGFQWLTHLVNYNHFPNSLKIVCVFDTTDNLEQFLASNQKDVLRDLIHTKLNSLKISLKHLNNGVFYDSEEQCKTFHNGNWAKRLKEVG